jgi:hypothetical protein
MDIPPSIPTPTPIIPVLYPKVSRELQNLSYGTIGPAPKKNSQEVLGLQSNLHVAFINHQVLPDHDK